VPTQAPTHHQVLQGQRLVQVPQDLNFTLVGQFGDRKSLWLFLLLLNDFQALKTPSSARLGVSGHQGPKCSLLSLNAPLL
jgi:hypothetical protein